MKKYKIYRYLFFWLSVVVYFVPYVVATAALLPFMTESSGMKWGIGLALVAINALPFLGGILRVFRAHFPFVNMLSFFFILLAGFFTLQVFSDYVYSFMTIEATALAGSIAACILWHFHRRYKQKSQTTSTMLNKDVLKEMKEAMKDA